MFVNIVDLSEEATFDFIDVSLCFGLSLLFSSQFLKVKA